MVPGRSFPQGGVQAEGPRARGGAVRGTEHCRRSGPGRASSAESLRNRTAVCSRSLRGARHGKGARWSRGPAETAAGRGHVGGAGGVASAPRCAGGRNAPLRQALNSISATTFCYTACGTAQSRSARPITRWARPHGSSPKVASISAWPAESRHGRGRRWHHQRSAPQSVEPSGVDVLVRVIVPRRPWSVDRGPWSGTLHAPHPTLHVTRAVPPYPSWFAR